MIDKEQQYLEKMKQAQNNHKPPTQQKEQQAATQKPDDRKLVKLKGTVGNSGKVFCCHRQGANDAEAWAEANFKKGDNWFKKGYSSYRVLPIFYAYEGEDLPITTETQFTVEFIKSSKK